MSTINLNDAVHKIEASDSDLATSTFEDVRLTGSTFAEVALSQSSFTNVLFDGSTIKQASFVGVAITDSTYDGMTIDGIDVKALLETYRAAQGTAGQKSSP
ncbi:pentapeptide repeat-containing protein [Myxococcus sp. K15C18031901]|uniref:pentapeptide repeat-containing protein n=1 Tax=Myxococcus dinghuensis TaxID=2906761 RepID=UPI0020A700EF|nr:pentapeptide repeat-containing protein [Myxococcus dinghuensis]MCP3102888.1 pentapeptide repeat-containing protein [Myxococcus dinghuensis]